MKLQEQNLGQQEVSTLGSYGNMLEANKDLVPTKSIGTISKVGKYEEMLRTSPIVKMGAMSMVASLLCVDYVVEGKNSKKAIEKYVNKLFFSKLVRPFSHIASTIFKAPFFGVAPHEITTKREEGLYWIKDLRYRPLRTFDLTSAYKNKDGYIVATQRFSNQNSSYQSAEFDSPGTPGKGWLFWPMFGDNGGIFGESILRPIDSEYEETKTLRTTRRIAERKALLQPPLLHLSKDAPDINGDTPDSKSLQKTIENLSLQHFHQNGIGALPAWVEKISQLYPDHDTIKTSIEAERFASMQILISFASQWVGRGVLTSFGTNAASKTDRDEQRNLRKLYIQWFSDCFDELIRFFVDLNFGKQDNYPKIKVIYQDDMDTIDVINSYTKLVKAQAMNPTYADQAHFRKLLHLPELDLKDLIMIAQNEAQLEPDVEGNFDQDTGEDTREGRSEGDYT